jgi:hypothetical protein
MSNTIPSKPVTDTDVTPENKLPPQVMPTSTSTTTPTTVPVSKQLTTKDFEQALEHVTNVKRFVNEYAGKPGHNPALWLSRKVNPLVSRYEAGERTSDLLKEMLSIPAKEVPVVNLKGSQLPPL